MLGVFGATHCPQARLRIPHQGGPQLDGTSHEDLPPPPAANLLISHDAAQDALPLSRHPWASPQASLRLVSKSPPPLCFQHLLSSRKLPFVFLLCTHQGAQHHRGFAGLFARSPWTQDPFPPRHGQVKLVPCGIYRRDGHGAKPPAPPRAAGGTSKCRGSFNRAPDAPSHFLLDSRLAPCAHISKTECKNRGWASPKHNSKLFPGKVTRAAENSSKSRGKGMSTKGVQAQKCLPDPPHGRFPASPSVVWIPSLS